MINRKTLTISVLSGLLLGGVTSICPLPAAADMASMTTMPGTKDEHQKMTEYYKNKAAGYRADAEFHRKMLADYKMGVASSPKNPVENPWVKKERLHCEMYIKEANKLAAQADEFAEFHTMRASEM